VALYKVITPPSCGRLLPRPTVARLEYLLSLTISEISEVQINFSDAKHSLNC
jgi:hypothetical protein